VSARPNAPDTVGAAEVVHGEIWRVVRVDGSQTIDAAKLNVDAVLGSNLREPAMVTVGVNNVVDHRILPPLPLGEVKLEMRQRRICFDAQSAELYALDYGDVSLHAPSYAFAATFLPATRSIVARLGPEQENPSYVAPIEGRTDTERHPWLLWIALLVLATVVGGAAIDRVKRRGRRR
jgi:hypothetical protein